MKTCLLDARTVAIVKDLKVEQRQGANGTYENKEILVRIAVDRDYKTTRQENGKTIQEYPTDFWLAKFTGNVAQIFADHCRAVKEDGKLVSRHLLLSGNFENYTNTREVTKRVNINGQLYDIKFDIDNNQNTIFIVDSMKFLDKNPANTAPQNNGGVVSVVPVGTAPANGASVPTAPVAQVAMPMPAEQLTPQVPVVQAISATQPVQVVDASQAMNPPVVDPNFVAAGQTAPF